MSKIKKIESGNTNIKQCRVKKSMKLLTSLPQALAQGWLWTDINRCIVEVEAKG